MSFKLGYEAFIKRFQKRFPAPEYFWQTSNISFQDNGSRPGLKSVTFLISKKEQRIATITVELGFGIRLTVDSPYLNNSKIKERMVDQEQDYRIICNRPLTVGFCNQHGMRHWLKNKPKFAMLASKWGAQIEQNLKKPKQSQAISPKKLVTVWSSRL